jgi:hypothetical protein
MQGAVALTQTVYLFDIGDVALCVACMWAAEI